jgi:RNA polymerase sigma factor (sigma-70 family)
MHAAVSIPDLVHDARQGDPQAWEELLRRYAGLVASVARSHRLYDADAADVAQATWLKLVVHLNELRDPAALGGWLATTARRECLRVLRDAGRVVPCAEAPDRADEGPEPDAALLAGERDAELWSAFSRLGQRDQALLRMLAADPPPSYTEIGVALDMAIGSIGPTRARALERLRRELDRAEAEPRA